MSKKILIFSTAYFPFVGGAEVAIKEITERLSGDFEFDLITARFQKNLPPVEKVGNVTVYRVGKGILGRGKFLLPFLGSMLAKKLHKTRSYNAIWSIMANQASIAASFFKKEFPNIPLVLTLQEGDEESHLKRYVLGNDFLYKLFIRPFHLLVFKYADGVTAISSYLKNRAISSGVKLPIYIIPNGVDINKFSREISAEEKRSMRQELGLKENDMALITVSRLNVKNGVGDVIKALTKLPENIKFIICGAGKLEQRLKLQTTNLGLQGRVVFKGFVEHSVLNKYLKACDIFIRPSLSEGLGNSFIEAMAAGLPVVATPVGGIVDFLFDGKTGYFCRPNDPASVAETVKRVIVDQDKGKITENAYKLAVLKYDWKNIAAQMKEIFDSMTITLKR